MSKDIESELRAALRPVAPSDEFSQKLVAQAIAPRLQTPLRPPPGAWRMSKRSTGWLAAGLAASLMLAMIVQNQLQQARARESGLEARREVVEALRMTSQKLNLAYETVKSQASSPADAPGA